MNDDISPTTASSLRAEIAWRSDALDVCHRLIAEAGQKLSAQARIVEVTGEIADTWRAMRRTWDPDGMGHLALELDKLLAAVEEGART